MEEPIWSFIIGVHVNLKNCKNISIIQIQLTAGTVTVMLVIVIMIIISDVGDRLKILMTSLRCLFVTNIFCLQHRCSQQELSDEQGSVQGM